MNNLKLNFFSGNKLRFCLLLFIVGYSLSSYSSGPAETILSCSRSSCHNFEPDKTLLNFTLKEKRSGLIVNDHFYEPNEDYIIELEGINKDSLSHFGFQTIATSSSGTSNGHFRALNPQTNTTLIGDYPTIAHNSIIETLRKGQFEISFEWHAPNSGAGDITFNSILNAVNFNGSTSGDQPSEVSTIHLKEKNDLKNTNYIINNKKNIYPNPCSTILTIVSLDSTKSVITVYDLLGHEVIKPSYQSSIDVSNLSTGMYLLSVRNKKGIQIVTFMKQ